MPWCEFLLAPCVGFPLCVFFFLLFLYFVFDSLSKDISLYLVISCFPFIFKQAAGSFMGRICMLGNFTPEQGLAT